MIPNGFFDNVLSGVTNPKGNLADWQHADRLYVKNYFAHAPRTKFLYHVTFYLTPEAQSVVPELQEYKNVLGMLVTSADLPSYTANVETKNKYNRKKNIQTNIEYNPVDITFHDDNFGTTTALLEAYFKYYFADSYRGGTNAYGNFLTGDTLYASQEKNKFKFGLDNNTPVVPFFDRIEIAQMSRDLFTKYTLVKPLLTDWKHDNVDNTDDRGTMQNTITVAYETVYYDRGSIEAGANGDPAGFGSDRYDKTPSPATIQGGGQQGIEGALAGAQSVLGGQGGLGQKAITGYNAFTAAQNINSDSIKNFALDKVGDFANDVVGNLNDSGGSGGSGASSSRQITFPKTRGRGAAGTQASESLAGQVAGGIDNLASAGQDFASGLVDNVTGAAQDAFGNVTDSVGDFFSDEPQGGPGVDTPGAQVRR